MSGATKILAAAGGTADDVYVEDLFSTFVYRGTGSSLEIDNNIDLDDKGGLVWIKNRDAVDSHILTDTTRGVTKILSSDAAGAEATDADTLTSFDSDGFTIGADDKVNTSDEDYVSWTFAKKEGFFDIVTYTGNDADGRTVAHNLGSVPGMIIVKQTNFSRDWTVYHRSMGNTKHLHLNSTEVEAAATDHWQDTDPTATQFTVGSSNRTNGDGNTYIAYLFAHTPNSDFAEDVQEYYANGSNISGFNGTGEYRIYVNSGTMYYNAGTSGGNVSGATNFSGIEALIETNTGQKVRTGPLQTSSPLDFYSIITMAEASSPVDDEESFITCGTYIGNGETGLSGLEITLGWEPQWVMIKRASGDTGLWLIADMMRGMHLGDTNDPYLQAQGNDADYTSYDWIQPTPTGFKLTNSGQSLNTDGAPYIFIAVRRPHKPPEEGTEVFSPYAYQDTGLTSGSGTASNRTILNGGSNGGTNFVTDMFWHKGLADTSYGFHVFDRLRGKGEGLLSDLSNGSPAGDSASNSGFDFMEGVDVEYNGTMYYYTSAAGSRHHVGHFFRRAPGFFDIVGYRGTSAVVQNIPHSLGAVPKMMLIKRTNGSRVWIAYFDPIGNGKYLQASGAGGSGQNAAATSSTHWNDTSPTESVFTIGTSEDVNANADYIAYLFGDVDGVSKIGSYTSDGSNNISVTTGFSPRFVMVKCTNTTTTNWLVLDTAQGMTTSDVNKNIEWNLSNAQGTDSDINIHTSSTGFTVKRGAPSLNHSDSGKEYAFLAIA
jgi:hypothetical protein